MIANTIAELAAVIGAAPVPGSGTDVDGTAAVTAVQVDSRQVTAGALFVALPGEHVDGHDYAAAAVAAGAVAAVTGRPVPGVPCLVVPDPLVALGSIGRHVTQQGRERGMRVIGITGSAGKTTTKDLLAQILERDHRVVAPKNSMNNEIGLPLTACRITADTRFLISEMGAKGIGHIRYLCELTPPEIGVELNVGVAHIGEFGSQEAIAEAKSELVQALPVDGVAVLNADDPRVSAMASRTRAKVLGFTVRASEEDGTAQVAADRLQSDDLDRWSFRLRLGDESVPVGLQLIGEHQIGNAVAAAATAYAVGIDPQTIGTALSQARLPSRWRMELQQRSDGLAVINDAYNANPTSMTAALTALARIGRVRRERGTSAARTVAVLGEMLELGADSDRLHAEVGRVAAESGIDRLVIVGAGAEAIGSGARQAGMTDAAVITVEDKAAAAAALGDLTGADVVLVKASRDIGLETVGDRLLADDPQG